MRANGRNARQKTRCKHTTEVTMGPVAANVPNQDFSCERPDQKWGADIRYIWTSAGWLYLAIGVDLYSRRSVSWEAGDRMKKALAISALHKSHCDPIAHARTAAARRQGGRMPVMHIARCAQSRQHHSIDA